MYRIIGGDGKEYGPVSADQVRQWIKEGRASGQTRIRPDGTEQWQTVSAFAEFADALAAGAPPPPALNAVNAEQLATDILARGYQIEIGSCISRGWELTKAHFWLVVGVCLVTGLIQGAIAAIPILGAVAGPLLGGVINGGVYYLFLKLKRGQPATFGDAFAGFSLAFVPLMLAGLVSSLLTGVGLLLCILPGIYLAVAWVFTLPLVIDKKLDFWAAMELSRKVITRNWWQMFGLLIVCFLVMLLGVLALVVGVFVAMPVVVGALAHVYDDIFAEPDAAAPSLQTPTTT